MKLRQQNLENYKTHGLKMVLTMRHLEPLTAPDRAIADSRKAEHCGDEHGNSC